MRFIGGIIISFFLALLLAGKKRKSPADHVLMLWLIITGVHFLLFYLFISGRFVQLPHLLGLEIPLPLLYGPLLFVYTTLLTSNRRLRVTDLLHLVPVALLYARLFPFLILPAEEKVYVYQHAGVGYEGLLKLVFASIIASGVTYIVLSLFILRNHRRNIEERFSNIDKINLNWLRYLIYGTSAIWVVIIAGFDDRWIYATAAAFVFFLGYFGIRQAGIFNSVVAVTDLSGETPSALPTNLKENVVAEKEIMSEPAAKQLPTGEDANRRTKYLKSSLTDESASDIRRRLSEVMKSESLYRNPELTLGDVARKLGVHPNVLSQVINALEGQSFYDYVNGRRIEEFKRLVAKPSSTQFTLLALAFEAGFNSKTAFNRNFKKATGLSPSEYLSSRQVELHQ